MSKVAEERKLLELKAQNILNEAVRAVEKEKADLEIETNIELVGVINPIGAPGIMARFRDDKKPVKCWHQSKETHEKKLREQRDGVWKRFSAICAKYEVTIGSVIRQDGAQIAYALTLAKQKSLVTVVTPPQPQVQSPVEEK